MEFHEKWSAPISLTRAVPCNSMELGVRQFCWHEQYLESVNFDDTSSWKSFENVVRKMRPFYPGLNELMQVRSTASM